MRDIRDFVGRRVRTLRTRQRLTQEALAERSGLHPTYIGQIERGEKNVSVESLHQIATALDITMYAFFQDAERAPAPADTQLFRVYDAISRLKAADQAAILDIVERVLAFRE